MRECNIQLEEKGSVDVLKLDGSGKVEGTDIGLAQVRQAVRNAQGLSR